MCPQAIECGSGLFFYLLLPPPDLVVLLLPLDLVLRRPLLWDLVLLCPFGLWRVSRWPVLFWRVSRCEGCCLVSRRPVDCWRWYRSLLRVPLSLADL